MRRTLTLILGVALFGILAAVVVASQGADDPASTETVTDTVERTTTVEDNPKRERADDDAQNGVDISGPCDEAEHANDPRCGGQAPATQAPAQGGVDISGPCDEAEHANDPRCTGVTPRVEDDDAPGHDRGDDHGDDRDEGERHDNSGPGNGDDDSGGDDDHSGHGGGGDDD
jgi:hypothetical protein